jgi:uncharacterized protein (DUF2267 family)
LIVNSTLKPGEKVRGKELASALGVSRTPVREALRRLEDEGLVKSIRFVYAERREPTSGLEPLPAHSFTPWAVRVRRRVTRSRARKGATMKGDEFIAEVRNLAELANNEEAESAIRATLQTLKERLAGNEPSHLAAQLPPEIASYVDGNGDGESFSVDEFYERVAQKEGVDHDKAVKHARAVATVLQTAVTGGEVDDVRSQLGNEYGELFGQPGASA